MKKTIVFLITVALFFASSSFAEDIIYERPNIKLIIDGSELKVKDVPIIINSRTLIPLRELLVGLGVPDNSDAIQWNGQQKSVKVVYNGKTINLSIGSEKAYINGKVYKLDSAPIIYQSRTYLPARFVGEALNYKIDWDSGTPAVLVTSQERYDELAGLFDDLKLLMKKVKYYNTASITAVNGKELSAIKEKADLVSGIIHTQAIYREIPAYIFKYATPKKTYLCTRYAYPYNIDASEWSITEGEEQKKAGILEIPENLYTALAVVESEEAYLIHNISNQYELLELFPEIQEKLPQILKTSEVKEYIIKITLDKSTKLPDMASVKIKYVDELNTSHEVNYTIDYVDYNKRVKIEIPEGLE